MATEILQKQLTQFGLNPGDWVLQKMKRNYYKIHCSSDENFCFVGRTIEKERNLTWDFIKLMAV